VSTLPAGEPCPVPEGPVELVERLVAWSDGANGGLDASRLPHFRSRALAFDHLHLGHTDVRIGALLDVIENTPHLLPPRTGHLGNWGEIVAGRAGAMDFNSAICAQGYGYPLIYAFNQTEDAGLTAGDWAYLPGSLVEDGQRTALPLYTWNGTEFEERDRDRPRFVPFTLTEVAGRRRSLAELHWARMQQYPDFDFRLEAAAVNDAAELVRRILLHLVEAAAAAPNQRRAFQDLFSHQVRRDAGVSRVEVERSGEGYVMGAIRYRSTEALVEAAMVPFAAVTRPAEVLARMPALPDGFPLVSNLLSGVLSAILCTHYPGARIVRERMTQPFNPHVHWGARAMAGYPPVRRGYFTERSTLKSYRRICTMLVDAFDEIDPLVVVLAPAAVFSLCPRDQSPQDAARVSELIERVITGTPALLGDDLQAAVDAHVADWLATARREVSAAFMRRFAPRQGVLSGSTLNSRTAPLEPAGFRDLTFRQACAIVGALHAAMAS
jgi:hypothetical protein